MSPSTAFCSISVARSSDTSIDILLTPKTTVGTGAAVQIPNPLFSLLVDSKQLENPIVIQIVLTQPATAVDTESVTESDSTGPIHWKDESSVPVPMIHAPPTHIRASLTPIKPASGGSGDTDMPITAPSLSTPRLTRIQLWQETQVLADLADVVYGSWPGSPSHPHTTKVEHDDIEFLRLRITPAQLLHIAGHTKHGLESENEIIPSSDDGEISCLPVMKKPKCN